jgi:endonuclease-3
MASNRSDIFKRAYKVIKKHFKPVLPNQRMPLLEQLVYASCLENATAAAADQAFTALEEQFFDWNEVRVSTVTELAEAMPMLPNPRSAGQRVKQTLQAVFEATYSFDIEALKKENIGVAVKRLQNYQGVTPFCVAYLTQNGLGGHSIPLGAGALEIFFMIGAIDDKEKASSTVPGLERAIPKNKGPEFGSLINQLGVEFQRTPFGPPVRKIILEIEPEAKDRLPKRRAKKAAKKKAAEKRTAKLKKPKKSDQSKPITKKVTIRKKKSPPSATGAKAKVKKKKTVKKKVVKSSGRKRKPK